MQHINLEHAGRSVSRVCFGTMTFGDQTGEKEAGRIIDRCLEAGINFIDTANIYNEGKSEEMLGRLLQGRRKQIVLASKVRGKMPDVNGLSRTAILRACEDSLRRLGTDYLDFYYLHMPDDSVPIEESLGAMDELVKQGKVRNIASSNFSGWQVVEMLWLAEKKSWPAPYLSQPMYNLLARGIEQEYLAMCKRFGIATFVYNPLAGGLLTGKQKRDAPIAGTRFDNNELYMNRYWHTAVFDAVDELAGIAAKAGRSLVSLALNWVYHHTAASGIILGASRLEQLNENLKALEDGRLDAETLTACDQVWAKLRGPTPKYNR
jgi:aryl-alcohol dehydrogenase-like predicted oxidoreductase